MFDKIPVPTIELPERRSQTFLYISLPEKLIGKSHHPQNETSIRGASPSVSGETQMFKTVENIRVYSENWEECRIMGPEHKRNGQE